MHHHVPVAEIVEVLYHHVSIPKPEPSELKEFRAFWKKTGGDNHIISGEYAFGSTTPGTLYKQWVAIRHFVIMTATDAILDHGAATGIVLFGKSFFSPFPNMRAMGQEVDEEIFKKLEQNLKKYPLSNTSVKKGDSKYRKDWAPASIVIAFEGAPITWIQPHHKTITLNLFRTPTMKCIFSTKLDLNAFWNYFSLEQDYEDIRQAWVLVKVPGLIYGSQKMMGYLWIKKQWLISRRVTGHKRKAKNSNKNQPNAITKTSTKTRKNCIHLRKNEPKAVPGKAPTTRSKTRLLSKSTAQNGRYVKSLTQKKKVIRKEIQKEIEIEKDRKRKTDTNRHRQTQTDTKRHRK